MYSKPAHPFIEIFATIHIPRTILDYPILLLWATERALKSRLISLCLAQENCKQIIDKYIEYDSITVFIDILLLKISAYRHFIFNTENKVSVLFLHQHSMDFYAFICRLTSKGHWYCHYSSTAMWNGSMKNIDLISPSWTQNPYSTS